MSHYTKIYTIELSPLKTGRYMTDRGWLWLDHDGWQQGFEPEWWLSELGHEELESIKREMWQ